MVRVGEGGDARDVESGEGLTVRGPLAQHRDPAQSGLRSLEDQQFEQLAIIVDGNAPLLVVIGDVQRVGTAPGAAVGHGRTL